MRQPQHAGSRRRWPWRCAVGWSLSAGLLALAVGVVDEAHQMLVPGRVAAWDDLLADAAGIVLALAWLGWRARGGAPWTAKGEGK